MPLPSVPQTFALENCRDVLEKLRWEIEGLRGESPHDAAALAHRAFNAAVTAWHVADWAWEDMTPAQREAFSVPDKKSLQNKARSECRALHLCRQIATASKHRMVTVFPDPSIDARVSAAPDVPAFAEGDSIIVTPPVWNVKIMDGEQAIQAILVFEQAESYWIDMIYGGEIAR